MSQRFRLPRWRSRWRAVLWARGACGFCRFWFGCFRGVSSASAAAEFLSLACPRERNQREGHPGTARHLLRRRRALRCSAPGGRRELGHPWPRTIAPFPAGRLRYSARFMGPGRSRAQAGNCGLAASCGSELARDQALAHREATPATNPLSRPRSLLHHGIGVLASLRQIGATRTEHRPGLHAFALGVPMWPGEVGTVSPQGRGHGCPRVSRRHRMRHRETPAPPHEPGRLHLPGGPLGCRSLCLLSLGQARESRSAAAEADETLRKHPNQKRQKPHAPRAHETARRRTRR